MNGIDLDNNFFGRRQTLELMQKRLQGFKDGFRQNVAVLGQRYMGKTTLLKQVIAFAEDAGLVAIYVDLENRDLAFWAQQMNTALLHHYLEHQKIDPQEDLTLLCAQARLTIPQTVGLIDAVSGLLTEQKWREAYHALLSIPEIFAQETGLKVVLIIDEFQALEEMGIEEVFADLGKRLMTQKNTLNIMASSQVELAQDILSEKLALLFGNFETIRLDALPFAEALGLLERNLAGKSVGLQLKNFVVDFAGGHPLYINLICQEIINVAAVYRQGEVYAPIVTQAIENVIFNPWGVLNRHFELLVQSLAKGKPTVTWLSVMVAMARGQHKAVALAEQLRIKPAQVTQRLNALVYAGVVVKNGSWYHIDDKVLGYWLKFVVSRRLSGIDLDMTKARKGFKEEITKTFNEFSTTTRKDLSTRFTELMHKFDDEAFLLNGRRYRLNRFSQVQPTKLRTTSGNVYDALIANAHDEKWLVILKKDPLLEHELNLLNDPIKALDPKPDRCVVVALSGMEDNARVRALAHKMWIWEEGDINALMHLFDEPSLVK